MENKKEVSNFLNEKISTSCVGCSIVNGDFKIPGGKFIYEGKYFIVAIDPEIPLLGFLVISSKKHCNSLLDFDKDERNEMNNLIYFSEKVLKELDITREITLVQEERSKHFHVWVYPSYPFLIEKFGKGITYFREANEYLKKTASEKDKENVINLSNKIREKFLEIYKD